MKKGGDEKGDEKLDKYYVKYPYGFGCMKKILNSL